MQETRIIITKLYKFKKSWKVKKAHRAVELMNQVINSEKFKAKVLEFNFQDTRYRASADEEYRNIDSNEDIYNILRKGEEQGSSDGVDFTWKLRIKLGRGLSQVGRRDGNLIITQNWFIKRDNNDSEVAAHWVHEYLHVLGFGHDYDDTERRPYSVPYGIGGIVSDLLNE